MSEVDSETKLIWLGLSRTDTDLSVVAGDIQRLQNNVDWDTFQSDLDAYDLDNDNSDEDITTYPEFKTYLTDNGFNSDQADTFIERIKNNFSDEDSSGSSFDEFEGYVKNDASNYTELKNAFNSDTTIGPDQQTAEGERVSGIRFYEEDGVTSGGVSVPAGTAEVYGKEIHFTQTAGPSSSQSDISFSNLTISDDSPSQGQTITISADIDNNGSSSGTAYAPLQEGGSVVDLQTVEVAANSSETVSFNRTYHNLSTFTVTIKDLPEQAIFVKPAPF